MGITHTPETMMFIWGEPNDNRRTYWLYNRWGCCGVNCNWKSCTDVATASNLPTPLLPSQKNRTVNECHVQTYLTALPFPDTSKVTCTQCTQCITSAKLMWVRPWDSCELLQASLSSSLFPVLHYPVLGKLVSAAVFPLVIYKWKLCLLYHRKGR